MQGTSVCWYNILTSVYFAYLGAIYVNMLSIMVLVTLTIHIYKLYDVVGVVHLI